MRVPFLDLSVQTNQVLDEFLAQAEVLVRANRFVGGEPVDRFEELFASYCQTSHCVALNSGTDALRLALMAAGLSPGQEVITSPFSFIATAEAISQAGGRPVFADVEPESFTISPQSVESKITADTFAVLPVHIFGLPADIPRLGKVADSRGLKLIEDACQAHGAEISGRRVGASGNPTSFSFYPSKNLGAFGDAGALTCSDPAVAERARLLKNHGQSGAYFHELEGYNSRMDTLQATLLSLKLASLDAWNNERRKLARIYGESLADVSEVRPQEAPKDFTHVYHVYALLAEQRDELLQFLNQNGVEAKVIYPSPIHLLPAYRHLGYRRGDLPGVELICSQVICLPLYPGLSDEDAIETSNLVKKFYAG